MGTTLVDELEQAASYFQSLAREFGSADGLSMCRKLRLRAVKVIEVEAMLSKTCQCTDCVLMRAALGPATPPGTPGDPQEKGQP